MPVVVYWGLAAGAGWLLMDKAGQTAERSAKLTKWAVTGGALYLAYRALQSAGKIK